MKRRPSVVLHLRSIHVLPRHVPPRLQSQVFARAVHSSQTAQSTGASSAAPAELSPPPLSPTQPSSSPRTPPLANLPLSQVLRTYLITSLSARPRILDTLLAILNRLLASNNLITSIERNLLLRWVLKRTFFAQFCPGENRFEVAERVKGLRAQGYHGVILEYALEVLKPQAGEKPLAADDERTRCAIEKWRRGMLETVAMAQDGDFVGLKWSGLGAYALSLLKADKPPTPPMLSAIHQVCDAAAAKNVGILPGAEEEATNDGIDSWTMMLQERYNAPLRQEEAGVGMGREDSVRATNGRAIMYTTYQSYLRSTPAKLSRHLAAATTSNHVLGIKLVRGAYLSTEPASSIWPSIEETHRTYDGLVESLLRRKWGGKLQPCHGGHETFPEVDVILATHNAVSVRKAVALRKSQSQAPLGSSPSPPPPVAIAQLMGMADELGAEILDEVKTGFDAGEKAGSWKPKLIKCATWGSLEDCLNFLLRRAAENRDAAGRTEDSRRAMGGEIWRRLKGVAGS